MLKQCVHKFIFWSKDTLNFVAFVLKALLFGNLKNPYSYAERFTGTVAVLANGPSLKTILPKLETAEEFQQMDFIVLNYFALDPVFTKIKPKHYCLADPMFFFKNHRYEEVRKLYDVLQEVVTWDMTIYVPNYYKGIKQFSGLTNPYIHFAFINALNYKGFASFEYGFYKKGLAMPGIETVAHLAIFVAINSGYKAIHLYGVDHNFFDSLCVDDKNRLCRKEAHFYDCQEVELKPMIRNDNDKPYTVSFFLKCMYSLFATHEKLAGYAKYMGVHVLNCTKGSMIDSYERK